MAWAVLALALAGCAAPEDPELMNLRATTSGPDEFGILPPKALEMPKDVTFLPEPTPGGSNLTDPNPRAEAIVALGGKARVLDGAVPSADAALVRYASRYRVLTEVRAVLAAEDLAWRQANRGRVLERLFNVNVYFDAYEDMSLDQHLELAKWRQAGVRTPSAPPRQAGE
ncbi:MAG: DUF3035 domain-containing protein [Paracoccaceae bacterium]